MDIEHLKDNIMQYLRIGLSTYHFSSRCNMIYIKDFVMSNGNTTYSFFIDKQNKKIIGKNWIHENTYIFNITYDELIKYYLIKQNNNLDELFSTELYHSQTQLLMMDLIIFLYQECMELCIQKIFCTEHNDMGFEISLKEMYELQKKIKEQEEYKI